MNENGTKRREWVKTVAIIFLIILLILTFFSNTIMNYSLPEVAAQYIQPGTITTKIRGNGMIESGDPYNVKIKGVRKVESVEVRQGDTVEKGQVLCLLSAEDSQELENAKKILEQAEAEFELALLTGSVDASVMNNAGKTDSLQNYKAKIIRLQNEQKTIETEVETAQTKVNEWQEKDTAIALQIALNNASTVDTTNEKKAVDEAKAVVDTASFALTEAQNNLSKIEAQINQQMSVSSGDAVSLEALNKQKLEANQTLIDAQAAYNTAVLNQEKAQKVLNDKLASQNKETQAANLQVQQAQIQMELSKVQKELTDKQKALTDKQAELAEAVKNINDEISLGSKYDAIVEAREEVEKLEKLVNGSEVVAPISGNIISVNVKSGLDTPEDGIVFTMQPEGEGYTMSFSVSNEQAKRVSVGDVAEPVNAWRYDDMHIVLSSIRPDPNEPAQKKLLQFSISGENVIPNQSLNVSVGERSGSYDMIVPNSAIREDNNGKFILIVESKSSPIGTRYTASRVDVDVIASDDTQSAISGALYGYEFVITTSTKPVEAGKQVRLP